MKAEIVTELDRLEELAPGWDALAVACHRPRSAPAWTVAWFRHALPPGALIRTVIVSDNDSVIGTAPFYVTRTGFGFYRFDLAAPMLHGVEPLCLPGRDEEVGEAIGAALAATAPTPDIVSLPWMAAGSLLPRAVRTGWARPRPALIDEHQFPSPRVMVAGRDFETWLGERSKKFRQSFRYDHRRLAAAGFEHRVSTDTTDILERLPDMQRLYERRRATRGGSGPAFDGAFMDVVSGAVPRSGTGRVRLSTIERPGEVIATDLIINGGGESSFWLSGFDEAWAQLGPNRVNLAMCIGDSMQRDDAVFDLGPGAEPYKYRFTEDEVMLQGRVLSRRGLRPFHTPAQLLPFGARQAAASLVGRLRSPHRRGRLS
jgi:CelD/BcsL family acetyltransferase involved in cellulose biosynthesis